ncbi:hypothetical protein JTB14_004723, partial [Gonioctena quinquepunctata]
NTCPVFELPTVTFPHNPHFRTIATLDKTCRRGTRQEIQYREPKYTEWECYRATLRDSLGNDFHRMRNSAEIKLTANYIQSSVLTGYQSNLSVENNRVEVRRLLNRAEESVRLGGYRSTQTAYEKCDRKGREEILSKPWERSDRTVMESQRET